MLTRHFIRSHKNARHGQRPVNPKCRCNSQISIPEPFQSMAKQLSFLALDVFVLVNLNCLQDYDWRTGFLLRCGMPLVVVAMIKAVATWRTRALRWGSAMTKASTQAHGVAHQRLCARCRKSQNAS